MAVNAEKERGEKKGIKQVGSREKAENDKTYLLCANGDKE
jgi:hypothetical protein